MSDTPRTESFIATCGDYEKWPDYRYRLHNFARSLEREVDALIHDNARLLESLNTEAKERCRLEDENAALAAAPTPPAQEDEPVYQVQDHGDLWRDTTREGFEFYSKREDYDARALYTRPQSDNSAEKIAQMLEAIKEVDVLIRNNLPVDKTTPAWGMIKKILYK